MADLNVITQLESQEPQSREEILQALLTSYTTPTPWVLLDLYDFLVEHSAPEAEKVKDRICKNLGAIVDPNWRLSALFCLAGTAGNSTEANIVEIPDIEAMEKSISDSQGVSDEKQIEGLRVCLLALTNSEEELYKLMSSYEARTLNALDSTVISHSVKLLRDIGHPACYALALRLIKHPKFSADVNFVIESLHQVANDPSCPIAVAESARSELFSRSKSTFSNLSGRSKDYVYCEWGRAAILNGTDPAIALNHVFECRNESKDPSESNISSSSLANEIIEKVPWVEPYLFYTAEKIIVAAVSGGASISEAFRSSLKALAKRHGEVTKEEPGFMEARFDYRLAMAYLKQGDNFRAIGLLHDSAPHYMKSAAELISRKGEPLILLAAIERAENIEQKNNLFCSSAQYLATNKMYQVALEQLRGIDANKRFSCTCDVIDQLIRNSAISQAQKLIDLLSENSDFYASYYRPHLLAAKLKSFVKPPEEKKLIAADKPEELAGKLPNILNRLGLMSLFRRQSP